jgi:hypothetical protein
METTLATVRTVPSVCTLANGTTKWSTACSEIAAGELLIGRAAGAEFDRLAAAASAQFRVLECFLCSAAAVAAVFSSALEIFNIPESSDVVVVGGRGSGGGELLLQTRRHH